jgi:hypothetical protein
MDCGALWACHYNRRSHAHGRLNGGLIAFVPMTRNRTAIIDREDEHLVNGWNWTSSPSGHAFRRDSTTRKSVWMHHLVFVHLIPPGYVVDHINGIPWDNRKCNLRLATQQQNCWNTTVRLDNSSGIRGVHFRSDRNVWESRIRAEGKIVIQHFRNMEDAIKDRLAKEELYFGEYKRRVM